MMGDFPNSTVLLSEDSDTCERESDQLPLLQVYFYNLQHSFLERKMSAKSFVPKRLWDKKLYS